VKTSRRAALAVATAALTVGGSVAVISAARWRLANVVAQVKETSDVYPLPPPEQMPVVSLGYRAAVADVVWAYVLVAQGLRLHDKRKFEYAARYFDTIFTLDPTYREPYLFLDAILTFGGVRANADDARTARKLLERGLAARPNDPKLFLQAGFFLAYIGEGYLADEEEKREWRLTGAKHLQRATELGAGEDILQHQGLTGATLLSRAGEREAAVSFLERAYAISDSEENRAQILIRLRNLKAEQAAERARASAARFEQTWRDELPFVSRTKILLLGPKADTYACAGPVGASMIPACARDWRTWTTLSRELELRPFRFGTRAVQQPCSRAGKGIKM
jgi:tetratricopeptide (TPR) repeat protein